MGRFFKLTPLKRGNRFNQKNQFIEAIHDMADYKEKIESRFILQKEKEDKLGMETRKHDNGGGM